MLTKERACNLTPSKGLLDDLDDYLEACIKLTWRMVTQVPPLRLDYTTFTFNSNRHKMVGCDSEVMSERFQEQRVCYLWPTLVDGGGRVISRGDVTLLQPVV